MLVFAFKNENPNSIGMLEMNYESEKTFASKTVNKYFLSLKAIKILRYLKQFQGN